MLGCRIYSDLLCSVLLEGSLVRSVAKAPQGRVVVVFEKKKQSVECSADSQKVMQCVKTGGGVGGGVAALSQTLDRARSVLTQHALCP